MIRLPTGFRRVAAAFGALIGMAGAVFGAYDGTVAESDWAAYRDRFVLADGRVVDDGNGGISHSEGQGYGLLLAVLGG